MSERSGLSGHPSGPRARGDDDGGARVTPRVIEARPTWGIARFLVGDEPVEWVVSHAEIGRDAQSAGAALERLGFTAGDRMLVVSMLADAPHFWPFSLAGLMAGGQLSYADASPFDAHRSAMFLRTLDYRVVLAVTDGVLDGLEQGGHDPAALLADVPVVVARGGAAERLAARGVATHAMALLGPAVALAPVAGAPPEVDPELWDLEAVDGQLVVTSRTERAQPFVRQPTGVAGTADGPRVLLS